MSTERLNLSYFETLLKLQEESSYNWFEKNVLFIVNNIIVHYNFWLAVYISVENFIEGFWWIRWIRLDG